MTQNPYLQQFPDVMKGKRIMYVHGFASSANSGTVSRLRQSFPEATILAFDLPVNPHEAIELLKSKCEELKPDLILGTSMGGMYTEQLQGFDRILVNPAFQIADTMREHNMMGKQSFLNQRADGVQEFYVDKPLVKEYREVSEQCFQVLESSGDEAKMEENERVFGLFGDEDPLVHTFDLFCEHYTQAILFHGEHRMDDRSFLNAVVPVIRWIDDKQEKRQRPMIFIAFDAMHDSYDKPVSSLVKAVMHLIETYNVYFYAPCPTNCHAYMDQVQTWLEKYISVPAHDHVVFTNQPQLLYGDYFIVKGESPEMMGSVIEFGSDEFKTWEEIIVYFDRLGGQ
ncbi:MAG: esterase [Prevotella sp.]|nr:esterase [Prevotella sp.]